MFVLEYSGVQTINATPTNGTATGSTSPATLTATTSYPNDLIITCFGRAVAVTFVATSGTQRIIETSIPGAIVLESSSSASGTNLTNSATMLGTANFAGVSIELAGALAMDWTSDSDQQDNFAYKASPNQYHGSFYSVDPDVDTNVPQYTFPSATDIILMDYKGYSIPTASKVDTTDYAIQFTVIPGITRLYAYDNDVENQVAQLVYATDRDVLDTGVELITLPPFIDDMWVVDDVEDDAS
jgi:hypothetical protein